MFHFWRQALCNSDIVLTKNVMLPSGMFRRTKWHCPWCDSEPQPTQQPNMVLFVFIGLRGRTSHRSDPNMFCVSSSHKSCKYRQRMTLSKKDLSTKYDKDPQSMCALHFSGRVELCFQRIRQFFIQIQHEMAWPKSVSWFLVSSFHGWLFEWNGRESIRFRHFCGSGVKVCTMLDWQQFKPRNVA